MRKNKEKETARKGIVLIMDAIESKMKDTMENGTKGVLGAMNPAAEIDGYAATLSTLADTLNKLS